VVTTGPRENRKIIAEGRYHFDPETEFPEMAFMVDEEFQGRGVATFLMNYLIEIGKERGAKGFQVDVLATNVPMLRVMDRLPYKLQKSFSNGVVSISWRLEELKETGTPAGQ